MKAQQSKKSTAEAQPQKGAQSGASAARRPAAGHGPAAEAKQGKGKRKTEKASGHQHAKAAGEAGGQPSHPEDKARDDRLAKELAANSGGNALSRHREKVTGVENEEDDVPEDEDALENAAREEREAGGPSIEKVDPSMDQ